MIALAAAPLTIGLLACLLSGRIARALQPRRAVPLLTALSLTVAMCTGIALSALAILAFAQFGPIPQLGHWSAPVLRQREGFPVAVGVCAFVVVIACLAAALVRAARSIRTLVSASHAARGLTPVDGDLVLVNDEEPTAYAVAGWRGRIVISRSMLAALSGDERRVVLAHESAHVRHRHHLYLHLTRVSAAANPLLRPVCTAVAMGIERWADEDAASEVHNREMAARGLARAALAQTHHRQALGGLAVANNAVAERVRALMRPAPAPRYVPILIIVVVVAACWLTAAIATLRTDELIQIAENALTSR